MSNLIFKEEGHEYFFQGKKVPCVSDILSHFGISDFSKVNGRVLDAAKDFGTNVHKTCELHDKNDLAGCDPAIKPYLNGWKKFKKSHPGEFDLIEKPLYSKVWNFAGTPDRILCNIEIDIKSGQPNIAHQIQTALYKILINENLPELKVNGRIAVYLKPNAYTVVSHRDRTDLSIAKSLISVYNWKAREGLL